MFSFLVILLSVLGFAMGAPQFEGRIVGGKSADIADYPYQISLMESFYHNCGGSILNKDTILTAAHCVDGAIANRLYVRAGSNSSSKDGQVISVRLFKMHPLFDSYTFDNDIAILKLKFDLVFGPGVQPIALPKQGLQITAGTKANVTGWGAIYAGGPSPDHLQLVSVPIVDQELCMKQLDEHFEVTPRHLCAGERNHDSCQGDSGGPLALNNEQIGIVSWGWGCAKENFPGVYARVSEYVSWIEPQM